MIKDPNMTPSDPLIEVIEEYDRVLNVRWEEHGGTPTWLNLDYHHPRDTPRFTDSSCLTG